MTRQGRTVLGRAAWILLLSLAVGGAVGKTLTNRQHLSGSDADQDRVEDGADEVVNELEDSDPALGPGPVSGAPGSPGGPWAMDSSWLFACPECDFISKIGMQKAQHAQNEL